MFRVFCTAAILSSFAFSEYQNAADKLYISDLQVAITTFLYLAFMLLLTLLFH